MSVQDQTLITLDRALAWARGEIRIEVRLPNGSIEEMNVMQYRRECETQERLRAHRGTSAPQPGLPPSARRL